MSGRELLEEELVSFVSNLPLLSDKELELLFSDDPDGARRYRMLHAVLVRGVTQREAAAEAGVSERTVRNVLRAYARGGSLEALRTRQAARRGRGARASACERALAEALAEAPLAGGDRLWRRAQELIGAEGARLSRRTAYRVLAELRARGRRSAPAGLDHAIRCALPLLQEDPPLTLGAGALARRLMPDEPDAALRGTLLRQALRSAIGRLRPAPGASGLDRSWWAYLICSGEYEEERNRADLQRELALSPSTYSRAKRQGLERIAAALPQIVAQMTTATSAMACRRLPRTPDFVGRHEEQVYYAWRLQAEGLAWLWGLPGSGKTVLAAEIAAECHRYGQRVLWHTCLVGRDATLAGVVRGLAEGAAGHADDELAEWPREAGAERERALALLETLRERLAEQPTLVVLDDVHRVDPADAAPLLALLEELAGRGVVRTLLVGRGRPRRGEWPALPGLREDEARLLWAGVPPLPGEQWPELYAAVAGLPQPIRLVAAAYRRAGELARPGDWASVVELWARDAIWEQLDPAERRVLAAAQLRDTPNPRASLVALCEPLGTDAGAIDRLRCRALLAPEAETPTLPALQRGAALLLREDAGLRDALDLLAAREAEASAPEAADIPALANLGATPGGSLELLARVRRALKQSAAYLHLHRGDHEANRLAQELAQLQAVLPDPSGARARPSATVHVGPRRGRVARRQAAPQVS